MAVASVNSPGGSFALNAPAVIEVQATAAGVLEVRINGGTPVITTHTWTSGQQVLNAYLGDTGSAPRRVYATAYARAELSAADRAIVRAYLAAKSGAVSL